ncbi:MAG: thioredoxin family protein [Caldimonas sp.]
MNTALAEAAASTTTSAASGHAVVPPDLWVAERKALLAREKELVRLRDELARARRALPWERVAKDYVFDAPEARRTLAELFQGRRQLLVQHFMLGPGWEQGCPSCSYMADHTDGMLVHLAHRDVSFVAVSRAPLAEIERFRQRMGWQFAWVSSSGDDFNRDFHVSFAPEDRVEGAVYYNYGMTRFPNTEAPGISVFAKDDAGEVFHTYSTFGRGVEVMMGTYNLLDLVPKGRDERDDVPNKMEWVRHHDRYGPQAAGAACCASKA